MLESQLLEMGMKKARYNIVNREDYDLYIYKAPEGYHFSNEDGVNFGDLIYGGNKLRSSYKLVKDEHFSKKKL